MTSDLILGIVIGIVGSYIVYAFVLPDVWSIWIAKRKNVPVVLLPLAALGFIAACLIFAWAMWDPFITALSSLEFAPWIPLLGIGSFVVGTICIIWLVLRNNAPATTRPVTPTTSSTATAASTPTTPVSTPAVPHHP